MHITYRLQKFALTGKYVRDYWSAETCGYSRLSTLVEKFNQRNEYNKPLEFEEDQRTPKGVYKDCTGAEFVFQLEMTQWEYPEHGNFVKVINKKIWQPNPLCPWHSDNAWGKPVPHYRIETVLNYLRPIMEGRSEMEIGYVAGVLRRSIEKDTLARNMKSLSRYIDQTAIYAALAHAMTG